MPDSLHDTVRRLMADIFELDASAISENAEMGVPEQWDSGNHVRLVLALEEEFAVAFEVSEIEAMTSFRAVVSTLGSKL